MKKLLFSFLVLLPSNLWALAVIGGGSVSNGGNISVVIYQDPLPGSTNYVQNRNSLQSGTSFWVLYGSSTFLSGTTIYTQYIVWPDGSVSTSAAVGGGGAVAAGGGSASLAIGTGSLVSFAQISSPTSHINLSTGDFIVALISPSTAFIKADFTRLLNTTNTWISGQTFASSTTFMLPISSLTIQGNAITIGSMNVMGVITSTFGSIVNSSTVPYWLRVSSVARFGQYPTAANNATFSFSGISGGNGFAQDTVVTLFSGTGNSAIGLGFVGGNSGDAMIKANGAGPRKLHLFSGSALVPGVGTLTLNTNGNIGISNSTPTSLLDVVDGSVTIRGTNAGLNVLGGAIIQDTFTITSGSFTWGTQNFVNTSTQAWATGEHLGVIAIAENHVYIGKVGDNIGSGVGGGGGSSSLAVATGSEVSAAIVSSPTAIVNLSTGAFLVDLTGGATALVKINFSSITAQGSTPFTKASDFLPHTTTDDQLTSSTLLWLSSNAAKNDHQDSWISSTFSSVNTATTTLLALTNALSVSTTILAGQLSPDISNLTYYLHGESTGPLSRFLLMASSPSVSVEINHTRVVAAADGTVNISSHMTSANDPGVKKLPSGVWSFTSWVSASDITVDDYLIITMSTVAYDGTALTEVLSSTQQIVGAGIQRYDSAIVQQNDVYISTSDRIVVRYFVRTNSIVGVTFNLYYAGTNRATHLTTPIGSTYKFTQLVDAPSSLSGKFGKYLSVNQEQTDLVFVSTITDNFNNYTSTNSSQVLALHGSTATLTTSIGNLQVFWTTANTAINNLQTFRSTTDTSINNLQTFRSTTDTSITNLQSFNSTMNTTMDGKMPNNVNVIRSTHIAPNLVLAGGVIIGSASVSGALGVGGVVTSTAGFDGGQSTFTTMKLSTAVGVSLVQWLDGKTSTSNSVAWSGGITGMPSGFSDGVDDVGVGGGGASSLAVGTGSLVSVSIISSPTAIVSFSSGVFLTKLVGGGTAYVSLDMSSVTAQGSAPRLAVSDWQNGSLSVYEEGSVIGNATALNCVGSGITCSQSGSTTTLTITAGAAGSSITYRDFIYDAAFLQAVGSQTFPVLLSTSSWLNNYMVRAFTKATTDYAWGKLIVPDGIDISSTVEMMVTVRAATSAATANVSFNFEHLAVNDNESLFTNFSSTGMDIIPLPANQNQTIARWKQTVSALGWASADTVYFRLSRVHRNANWSGTSNLLADLYLLDFRIRVPYRFQ